MKPFRRKGTGSIRLEITPLLDIMFMLLLFFLLTSSFLNPSIELKLPEASSKEKLQKQDIIISIDKKGTLYLNRDKTDIVALPGLLKERLALSDKKKIIFQGDENILYKKFVQVMDIIKRSGAREINIAHEKGK
ncbi:MAG: biopolymer transporter ExbD [bacterium]|nr:biopolymer transporter ExbD [bacterium]